MSIYEFMPLDGDETETAMSKEEIEKRKEAFMKAMQTSSIPVKPPISKKPPIKPSAKKSVKPTVKSQKR